jgi:hypothetical protein
LQVGVGGFAKDTVFVKGGQHMDRARRWFLRGFVCVFALASLFGCGGATPSGGGSFDVVVLGGTSGGVAAAVQAARMGKSVVLIESSEHLGGLTSGGLGATDIGNKKAIGGIARQFYHRVYLHYLKEDSWVFEKRGDYGRTEKYWGRVEDWDREKAWWMFEPHVAEAIFEEMIRESKVPVVYGERLELEGGVQKQGSRIVAIKTDSGRVFRGKMFIDATYEGDLMAGAGVSYVVGRESNSEYGETLNGVQTENAQYHQFEKPVDPYVRPGDPASGLLPRVHGGGPGAEGERDHRVQAYCFRMCLTDVAENRVAFAKPKDYEELRYELLLRYYEAGYDDIPWLPHLMPNRKTDTNNKHGFSTDNIGMNYDYPDANYAARERIIAEHASYQKGLMWTLANHPRVPVHIREQVGRWGLAKDEFTDNDNWPHQLYVREARRIVSDYVMTEQNCRGQRVALDSVGLGAYGMDSHNTQRYVDEDGHARNEGDVQVSVADPYPISYLSIIPRASECTNLLAPVCVSATHIAFGSIRMEPVFMVLGQSAATAACLAMDEGMGVQDLDYQRLRKRLLRDGQVLEWK